MLDQSLGTTLEDIVDGVVENTVEKVQRTPQKGKRDIFRFAGEKPCAIDLQHVTQINVDGKRITFQFYNTAMYIDLADDAAALSVFEVVLSVWAGRE